MFASLVLHRTVGRLLEAVIERGLVGEDRLDVRMDRGRIALAGGIVDTLHVALRIG